MGVDNQKYSSKHNEELEQYQYIIAIGISTGGPKLLNYLLANLQEDLSATYIIVQHMPAGFTKALANRLNTISKLHVKEAEEGEKLRRGVVYIAPGGMHLKIINGLTPQIMITDEVLYRGAKPSVNMMMDSLATLNLNNKKIIAIIMTGMGSDGLEGVKRLKATYGCKVIAQDESTSTVYGMPKAIINAGLADYIVQADQIIPTIKKIVGDNHGC